MHFNAAKVWLKSFDIYLKSSQHTVKKEHDFVTACLGKAYRDKLHFKGSKYLLRIKRKYCLYLQLRKVVHLLSKNMEIKEIVSFFQSYHATWATGMHNVSFLILNPSEGDVREALLCSRDPKRSKIMFLHKFGSFPTGLSLFQNFFSTNLPKNCKN